MKISTTTIFMAAVCIGFIHGMPQDYARYDTNSSIDDSGGGLDHGWNAVNNNTVDLLDLVSLIINQDSNSSSNKSMMTFEDTMGQLDTLIEQLDQMVQEPQKGVGIIGPQPRVDSSSSEAMAQYEALLELKHLLDQQFSDYSTQNSYPNPHEDVSLRGDSEQKSSAIFNDQERLKIPLVGAPDSDPSALPLNEDTLNILVRQGDDSQPGVAIYPVSETSELKENISSMIGVDFDELIKEVSQSIGQVQLPIRVEEHHTQVTEEEGAGPLYKYTETIADIIPSADDPRSPGVNVLSKRYEEGALLGTDADEKMQYRWVPSEETDGQINNVAPVRNFGPTLGDFAGNVPSSGSGEDVKVNVTTKTNIVNVFTFNIFINNDTDKSFTLVKDSPVKSSIQTTANIQSKDKQGKPLSSISLYQYSANDKKNTSTPKTDGETPDDDNSSGEGAAELEKWLKVLLNHQAYGDGSNIVAEAVLKDKALQQIPEPKRTNYRLVDQTTTIGPLGYKTDMNGDFIYSSSDTTTSTTEKPTQERGLMETLAGSPIPTIIAGLAALSPYILAAGKKRRRRSVLSFNKGVEIPDQWLSYLLGTRYGSSTPQPTLTPLTTAASDDVDMTTTTLSKRDISIFNEEAAAVVTDGSVTTTLAFDTTSGWYEPQTTEDSTISTKTTVFHRSSTPSVQISKLRPGQAPAPEKNKVKVESLLKHWANLYNTVKDQKAPSLNKYYSTSASPTTVTTIRPTTTTTTTVRPTTSKRIPTTTNAPQKPQRKWSFLSPSTKTPIDFYNNLNSNGSPVKIIDENVSVSTSTSTEVNLIPFEREPFTQTVNRPIPSRINSGGRIKSTNVSPNLWLTAKDILSTLGTNLLTKIDEQEKLKNQDMTNSPIVIIPVEDDNQRPPVNVQALKPIVNRNPITFINMNNSGRPKPIAATVERVSKPPSKLYVESFWSKYNKTFSSPTTNEQPSLEAVTQNSSKILTLSSFPIETTTVGIRKPAWNSYSDPNSGVGSVEEVQVPPSVVIMSPTINTNLTPDVIPNLMEKLEPTTSRGSSEVISEDFAPLALTNKGYMSDRAKLDDFPSSYESYDVAPQSELVEALRMQLKNSPLNHALNQGQWVYESQHYTNELPTPFGNTKNAHELEWMKNIDKDIQPTRNAVTTTMSTTKTTSTTMTTSTTSTSTTTTTSERGENVVDTRLGALVALGTATTTTQAPSAAATTTTESPKTIGEVVATALSQSAAPLAGLSAASLAYGLAAMLPVWLPLALGKRKRKKRTLSQNEWFHLLSQVEDSPYE